MRLRLFVPCAATLAVLVLPASPASAAPKRCAAKDGVFVQYEVHRGSSRSVTCSSALRVLMTGALGRRPPSAWSCRQPPSRSWPLVERCVLRVRGRRTATAGLYATDDFFAPGAPAGTGR